MSIKEQLRYTTCKAKVKIKLMSETIKYLKDEKRKAWNRLEKEKHPRGVERARTLFNLVNSELVDSKRYQRHLNLLYGFLKGKKYKYLEHGCYSKPSATYITLLARNTYGYHLYGSYPNFSEVVERWISNGDITGINKNGEITISNY